MHRHKTLFIRNHEYFSIFGYPWLPKNPTIHVIPESPSGFVVAMINLFLFNYFIWLEVHHIINVVIIISWVVPILSPFGEISIVSYLSNYIYLKPLTVQYAAESGIIIIVTIHPPSVKLNIYD